MAKDATLPTPSHGKKLTIGFGLVNVSVAIKSLTDNARPVPGKGMCPTHGPALASVSLCSQGTPDEHVVPNAEKLTAYPHPDDAGRMVVVDPETVKALSEASDGQGVITRIVEAGEIDSAYTEKAFMVYPQAGHEQAFDLLVALLRPAVDGSRPARAALVDVVLYKQTETLAVRWHEELGVLVAETIRFEQKIRHSDAELIRVAAAARPAVDDRMIEAAQPLLAALEGVFDASEAQDTWTPLMHDAIRAADKGETFVAPAAPEAAPVIDLMAALQASVAESKPKKAAAKKPAAKRAKKVAA